MIFTAQALELLLKLALLRSGGGMTFRLDDADMSMIDDYMLFAEAERDGKGMILTIARVGDDIAGHA